MELSDNKIATDKEQNDADNEEIEETTEQRVGQASMQDYQLTADIHKRIIKAPKRLGYENLIAYTVTTTHDLNQDEYKTYAEVVASQ